MDGHIMKMIDIIPKDGSVFDIQKLFFLLTMDSATHFLFGESVGSLSPASSSPGVLEKSTGGAQGFADAFNLAQEYLAARSRAQGFYWMINPREFHEATRKVHNLVDHYVRLALQSRNKPAKPDDRYIFLQALAADSQNPKVLRDNLLNILLAGRDTTASLLSSAFFLFARHPHVWHRLRRDVIREFGDCNNKVSDITHAKLKDLSYLRHVLNEGKSDVEKKLYLIVGLIYSVLYNYNRTHYGFIAFANSLSQSSACTLRCRSTSVFLLLIHLYLSVVVRMESLLSTSGRTRQSHTWCTPCTDERIYGVLMRNRSDQNDGKKMESTVGSIFLLTVDQGFVWAVSAALSSCFTPAPTYRGSNK